VPLEVIVCIYGNRNTLGVLYISYSVVDDQRQINEEGATSSKGAHLSLLRQRQNMNGNDSTVQGKTKHTPT